MNARGDGLVERESERAALDRAVGEAASGRGSGVLIEGPPGIGKTALLEAARESAAQQGLSVLEAHGGELERELGFAVARGLFVPALRAVGEDDRPDLLAGAAEFAAGPLGLDPRIAGPAAAPSDAAILHGLYWLCANLADRAPRLIAIDDLHWVDEPSLRFLSYLVRRVGDHPLAILATSRPRDPRVPNQPLAALEAQWSMVLRPGPLSERGVTTIVRRTLSDDADDDFCAACERVSGGNPFLLTEALIALSAEGVEPVKAEADRLGRLEPGNLTRALSRRIARAGPHAPEVAGAVAILGDDAELRRIASLTGLTVDAVGSLIESLRREGILAGGDRLAFAHPLIRTAIYGELEEPGRGLTHLAAARLLSAEGASNGRLTPHLLAAAPNADAWVVGRLRDEAATALARGAPEPAVALLERALAEPPGPDDRVPVFVDLGRALGRTGRVHDAAQALEQALRLAQDQDERGLIALELTATLRNARRATDAIAVAREILDELPADTEVALTLELELAMASHLGTNDRGWMERLNEVAASVSGAIHGKAAVRGFNAYVGAASGAMTPAEVIRVSEAALEGFSSAEAGPLLLQIAAGNLAMAGELERSLELSEQALGVAQELGDIVVFSFVSQTHSWVALRRGRVLEAEADARAGLQGSDYGGFELAYAVGTMVSNLLERDALDEAEATLAEYGFADERELRSIASAALYLFRGRLHRLRGRLDEALKDLLLCGTVVRGAGLENPAFFEWRADAALTYAALGDADAAAEIANEELDLAQAFGAPREIGIALRTLGQLQGGGRGLELLAESTELLAGTEAELEHARTLVEYGAALRRAGRRSDAQDLLRRGLDRASRCGALRIARQAREELVAAGAKPRRERLTGPESLTASELRVARMAADGLSNREIAQALFVTRRTVENHLTSAYRKLEIESRNGLGAALDER
jgi:DNA-binding CsgD family transcriptional regulator